MHIDSFTEVNTQRGAMRVRRRFTRLSTDMVRIDQRFQGTGVGAGLDVTGPYWVFGIVSVRGGRIFYARGRNTAPAPGPRFAVFLPPYSIVHCRLEKIDSSTRAIACAGPAPAGLPSQAAAFAIDHRDLPGSIDEVLALIGTGPALVPIGREDAPRPISRRLKALIDDGFADLPPMASLAARLQTSPAVISRYFRHDYGMPPVRYRHAVRVMDAMMRLAAGERVADVAGRVGFRDLSQFYRQFGLLAVAPPGRYHFKSRTPKTR